MTDEWTQSAFWAGLGTTVFVVLALQFPLSWLTAVLLLGAGSFIAVLFQQDVFSTGFLRFISAVMGMLAMFTVMLEIDISLPAGHAASWSVDSVAHGMISTVLAMLGAVLITTDMLLGLLQRGAPDHVINAAGESLLLRVSAKLPDWSVAAQKTSQFVYLLRRELQFKNRYLELLIEDHRDYQMRGLQSQSPFVLDLEKIFVPLRVSAQSLHRISSHMLQIGKTSKTHDIWDYLAADPQVLNRCMVILGPPGSGKTTLLEHLTLVYANRAQAEYHRQAPADLIPIFLSLRDHREQLSGFVAPTLADLIQQQSKLQRIQPPANWFYNCLRKGQCLVLLDGLDEVADDKQRKAIARWISVQIGRYQKTRFILTSRPFGYRSAKIKGIGTVLEVKSFSLQQINQFIGNWYLQHEILRRLGRNDPGVRQRARDKAEDLRARIMDYKPLRDMAINPLLMTMIAAVHDNRGVLPGRRVELYEEICSVLLARRQESKRLTDEQLSVINKRRMLQLLALALMRAKTRSFIVSDVAQFIHQRLAAIGWNGGTVNFLEQIEKQSGLLIQRETDLYEFTHLSFQEYLAAVEIKEEKHQRLLLEHLQNPWWEEVIRLYAVQSGDASELIAAILHNPTVNGLRLAYECIDEGAEIQPAIRRALLDKIDMGLEADDPEVSETAAHVRLSLRLNKGLHPIDDHIFIDNSLISNAEYQLFIDDMREQGKHHWPLHWSGHHFAGGDSTRPVTGIRVHDAQVFCQWLSARYAEFDYCYRLPDAREAAEKPLHKGNLGYWRRDNVLEPVLITKTALDHRQLWEASFNDLLYSNHSTWDIVEDLAKSFLLLFDRTRNFMHWTITFLDQIAESEVDYNRARISDSLLYKDIKFSVDKLQANAERIQRFYNSVRGFIKAGKYDESQRHTAAAGLLQQLIQEQKIFARLNDKLEPVFVRIDQNNQRLSSRLKHLRARMQGIDYMMKLGRELLLTMLEELDRAAATSYRKPIAISDGIDIDAVFAINFSCFYEEPDPGTAVFPDYHQILNDIFMNNGQCAFDEIVTGLQALIDDRSHQRDRELSRTLLLLVLAVCQLTERSNGNRPALFPKKLDNRLKNQAFAIYSYFNLMDRRHHGRLPAWEGLRIVREYRL